MKITNKKVISLTIPFVIFILVYEHSFIWKNLDKIGALATAVALFAAMYQGYVAWSAAKSTSEANAQNFFQQKFNLILEQHNNTLALVTNWLKINPLDRGMKTQVSVMFIRGHENLSPYMRILYHTLKSIRTEMPNSLGGVNCNLIKTQKKYTSLVRSFIPNDVLYAIAINASVFDGKKFLIPDSNQYKYYYRMLMDYDFFEHLIIKSEDNLHLKKVMKELSYNVYQATIDFYTKLAGFSLNDKMHLKKVDELFGDVDFYICLVYDLRGKYITIPEYIPSGIKLSDLAVLLFKQYQERLSPNELLYHLSKKTDEIILENSKGFISNINYYHKQNLVESRYGLFNYLDMCELITSNLKFNNEMHDIITFRDNCRKDVRECIEKSSKTHKANPLYSYDVSKSVDDICEMIENISTKLILMRQEINYGNDIKKVFNKKGMSLHHML